MSERSVFLNALDKNDPAERAAYLDEACAGDADLRRRVEELIGSHYLAGSFMEAAAVNFATPTGGETWPRAGGDEQEVLALLDHVENPGVFGTLKHYEVVAVVGRGGMGIVLKAFDPTLSRFVAIKLMAPQLAAAPSARRRFEREAKAAAAISHEHVVAIYEVNEFKGVPYLVMEFVQGKSLQQRLDDGGAQTVKEVLRIGHQTASGLAAAHAQGLVHRDIKPDNILLHNGVERVKITDFGLARATDDTTITQPGVITGTPAYMSPEQARGETVDHRSDLFSLGSVLYAMCAGKAPFRGDSLPAVLKKISEDEPRPLHDLNPDVPEWLEAIIERLHAHDPRGRFQSAKEIADLLGQHLAHLQQPDETPMPAPVAPRRAPARRSRMPVWLVLLVISLVGCVVLMPVMLVGAAALFWVSDRPAMKPPIPGDGGIPMSDSSITTETRSQKSAQNQLQGTWRARSCINRRRAESLDTPNLPLASLFTVTFANNQVRTNRPDAVAAKLTAGARLNGFDGQFRFDPDPIDIHPVGPNAYRLSVTGSDGKLTFTGCVRVDGDRLSIWYFHPDEGPPGVFPPEPENAPLEVDEKLVIWEFRRAAPARDEDRLQGSWRGISGERQGKPIAPGEIGVVRMKFTGSQLEAEFDHGNARGTFTLNPTAEPKQITVRSRTDNNMAMEGIYRFDGDKLILCMGNSKEDRPAKFTTDPSKPTLVLVTLEREN